MVEYSRAGQDADSASWASPERLQAIVAWALIAAAFVILVYRSVKFGGYFPDDAYITFRFAEHLSQGYGIVWNIDGPPVEGSTSFLQTLMLTIGLKMGFTVSVAAYLINAFMVAALITQMYLAVLMLSGRFSPGAALPIALLVAAFPFSVHVNSGMETVISMTLLLTSFLVSLLLATRQSWSAAIGLSIVNFLCLWCRPDAAPFIFGQGLVLAILALTQWRRGDQAFFFKTTVSYALLVVAGLIFLAWKLTYFGYILPNSFYVKASDPMELSGLVDVVDFLEQLALKFALLLPLACFVDFRRLFRSWDSEVAAKVALLVVPPTLFLLYNITTLHLVGFYYRFEYPVAPFFFLAAAWILSSGLAYERLQRAASSVAQPMIGTAVSAGLVVGLLGMAALSEKSQHRKWFRAMQVLHYEPVAFALSNSGAGHDGTLVFDSAGFIPYDSGFSLIDPVGLTDNVLSGRDPITPMEREAYIWGSNPDVYLGPVPPAGKGFDEGTNDPVVQSAYAQNVLLNQVMFKSYSRFISDLPHSARLEVLHVRMRELRDNWIAVGEIPYPFPPVPEYTHFLYVRKDSPFADNLVGALSQVVTRKLEEVDFNNVTDGQLRHDFKSVHQIELQLGG